MGSWLCVTLFGLRIIQEYLPSPTGIKLVPYSQRLHGDQARLYPIVLALRQRKDHFLTLVPVGHNPGACDPYLVVGLAQIEFWLTTTLPRRCTDRYVDS